MPAMSLHGISLPKTSGFVTPCRRSTSRSSPRWAATRRPVGPLKGLRLGAAVSAMNPFVSAGNHGGSARVEGGVNVADDSGHLGEGVVRRRTRDEPRQRVDVNAGDLHQAVQQRVAVVLGITAVVGPLEPKRKGP